MSYKNYLTIFVGSLVFLASLYLIEMQWVIKLLPGGVLLGGVQCLVGLCAGGGLLLHTLKSRDNFSSLIFLCLAFCSFAIADFFWAYLFYFVKLSRYHWLAVTLTQIPYGLGYLGMTLSLLIGLKKTQKTAIILRYLSIYLLVTVPFFIRYIAVPTIGMWQTNPEKYFLFGHTFNIINTFLLANAALIIITIARDLFWSLIATGCATLILENWSFRAEMLHWNAPNYGFYDYLWGFGILTAAFPVISQCLISKQKNILPLQRFEEKSLVSQSRFWIIASILIALTILTVATNPQSLIIRFVCVGSVTGLVFAVFLGQFLAEKIEGFAVGLTQEAAQELGLNNDQAQHKDILPFELRKVYTEVFEQKLKEQKLQQQLKDELSKISAQVAHDIRSPLAALSAATQGLSELPEDKRIMIRSAVQRIGDIANDLAGRGKQRKTEEGAGETVQLLSGSIDALISEKRLQFRSRLEVNIQSTLENKSYGLFAKVEPAQFKRVLSNLVNNAVEAIADHGTVSIGMKQDRSGKIVISVSDTGAGIPPEILSKLTHKGATFGKKDGQGLGLFHARESIEAWGGEINLTSEVGKGTMVTVTLPFEREPAWFVQELVVYPGTQIIILDDDESIHQIWKGRFETKESGVALHHFSNGAALRDWYAQAQINGPLLILCDYEILGSDETGLDVIKSLELSEHTTLVTSRFEEKNVREGCEQLGIRLLPKNLAGFVPIKFVEIPSDLEFVLIDDSRMNRNTWEIMARAKKRKVITFERPKDFYAVDKRINKDAKFYVDLNLGDGVSGIDITREINSRGFENIFLYTGEDHVDTQDMPWIKGVVGKSLPFAGEKS